MRNFILDRGIAQHGVLVADYSLTVSEFAHCVGTIRHGDPPYFAKQLRCRARDCK